MPNTILVELARQRLIAAAVLGGEVGAAVGLLLLGGQPLAPLATTAIGAALGPPLLIGLARGRAALLRRRIREQLRHAAR